MRQVRPEAVRRRGPEVVSLSACPRPVAWRALHPARWECLHSVQPAAARRDGPAVWLAWWSARLRSAVLPAVRRDAAVLSSCCRRGAVAARPPAGLPEMVQSRRARAFQQPEAAAAQAMASPSAMKAVAEAAGVVSSALLVASAPWVRRPEEAAVVASDAQVRPRAAAAVQPAVLARQPGVAAEAAVSDARGQPPAVAAEPVAEAVQPRAAAEAVRDVAAVLRRAAVQPAAEAQQPAAERRASAVARLPSSRRGDPLRGLAPR